VNILPPWRATHVKKRRALSFILVSAGSALAGVTFIGRLSADNDRPSPHFKFVPNGLVLSRSVYVGTAETVTIGETVPRGCTGGANGSTTVSAPTTTGGTTPMTVPCGVATDNGEFPNLSDSHNVWNNAGSDASFAVTSPIFLDNLAANGSLIGTLPIPSDQIVSSFTSKSELAPKYRRKYVHLFALWYLVGRCYTLYMCDEGDGTLVSPAVNGSVEDAQSLATAGVQKWSMVNGTWTMLYVLQEGLNIGVPYSVPNYPASLNPATGGFRNMTGRHNHDGTVTIFAITSTISAKRDQGADPNKLVKVRDLLAGTSLQSNRGIDDGDGPLGHFVTVRSAKAGEVFRGVALAPTDDHDEDHD